MGLADGRAALLSGFPRAFVATLPRQNSPAAQLWIDLNHLNQIPKQDGDDHPLETWLHTALLLTAYDARSEIFRRVLQELQNQSRETSASSPTKNTIAEFNREGFQNNLQSPASPEQGKAASAPPELRSSRDDPVRVFLDYETADEPFARVLRKHLSPLVRLGRVRLWDSPEVPPGGNIEEHIAYQLNIAHLFLPLLSADYLASQEAFRRSQFLIVTEKLRVIPILARPCRWELTPFAITAALPKHKVPISLHNDLDEAMAEIVHDLSAVIDDIRRQNAQSRLPILPQTPFRPNATLPTPAAATSSPSAPPQPSPEAKPGTPIHLILRRNGPPKWNYIEPEGSSKISREL